MISLIAAVGENRVIGTQNKLPWHLPADFAYFKKTTAGHTVIMGRKTFESMDSKPLPNRKNVIVTRDSEYKAHGCVVMHSLNEALAAVPENEEAFVIGGAELFKQALPRADRIYITYVHAFPEGDAFFPEFDLKEWREISRENHDADKDNQFAFDFVVLERIS